MAKLVNPSQYIAAIEHNRAERLKAVDVRITKAENKVVALERSEEVLREKHKEALQTDAVQAKHKEAEAQKSSDRLLQEIEVRRKAVEERREACRQKLLAVEAEEAELQKKEVQLRAALTQQINHADLHTTESLKHVQEQVELHRRSGEEAAKQCIAAVKDEGRRAKALYDEFGGFKEAISGATSMYRDRGIRPAPVPRPRPFDCDESPFDGYGSYGLKANLPKRTDQSSQASNASPRKAPALQAAALKSF
eukprot:TRINITY_DN65047_c0_g1_i1.p1 TRINITY_DN65047_c0_g1~~TRINITY_DN65047_c0_g1_i1.p1  ORF type:complete len:251 (+),score=54.94 TRINITY_DN65047_c0_g1_i1:113-865(+)